MKEPTAKGRLALAHRLALRRWNRVLLAKRLGSAHLLTENEADL